MDILLGMCVMMVTVGAVIGTFLFVRAEVWADQSYSLLVKVLMTMVAMGMSGVLAIAAWHIVEGLWRL